MKKFILILILISNLYSMPLFITMYLSSYVVKTVINPVIKYLTTSEEDMKKKLEENFIKYKNELKRNIDLKYKVDYNIIKTLKEKNILDVDLLRLSTKYYQKIKKDLSYETENKKDKKDLDLLKKELFKNQSKFIDALTFFQRKDTVYLNKRSINSFSSNRDLLIKVYKENISIQKLSDNLNKLLSISYEEDK